MEEGNENERKVMRSNEELDGHDLSKLPQAKGWYKQGFVQYQGIWCPTYIARSFIRFQRHFKALDQDIILASSPKSGSTWMKALVFSVLNRDRYDQSNTPLLSSNPHDIVPSFESSLFSDNPKHDLAKIPSPRLFGTHILYSCLPEQVICSGSRIVYLCRNPLDSIVSFWHYIRGHPQWPGPDWSLEDCVEAFCRGESMAGPFWDQVLGFWRASLKNPNKVLFLKYEDVWEDTASHVNRVAEFLGFPFSLEEKEKGVVDQIVDFCSFENLKELDVNKHGKLSVRSNLGNKVFFRKGEVGDWINHLSPSMVESVNKVIEEKLGASGLTFRYKI